jgi:cytoplasmic iron level regulating protein YaaA (DUF328/UPF0246 family)
MPTPLVLLPPSEGKAPGGGGPPWPEGTRRFGELDAARREVAAALRRAMRGDRPAAVRLLGVGAVAAEAAIHANLAVDHAPTRPAIERYTGVLYDALAYTDLPSKLRRRVDAQVVIVSALWGAVAPRDPLPDYKLKMGATLPGLGRLSTWWRPRLSPVLDELADGRVVWNLLPNEHAATWKPSGRAPTTVTVRFLDDVARNDRRELVTVSHWNKLLKGALVRYVLEHQVQDPGALVRFTHPQGYTYRPELTAARGDALDVAMVARR